jgi:tetratricopeptide (TPR) repeat protein
VIVFAGRRNSDEEGVLGLGFTILEAEGGAKVEAREREIKNLNLEESSKRLLIAYLYAGRELNAEAIMQLEEESNDPEVVRVLAELYLRTLLTDKAEKQYLRAIELSSENILGLALAHDRLGQIYEAFVKKGDQGKKDQAIQKYENAIKAYMDLKNWKMVGEIAGRLGGLQKP